MLGGKYKLYFHIIGFSGFIGHRNSVFISTTSNHTITHAIARERVPFTGQTYYIYHIRITDNMYPALKAIDDICSAYNMKVDEIIMLTVTREREYSSYSDMVPEQIRSVEIIRFTNGLSSVTTQNKPNYFNTNSHSHGEAFENSNSHLLNCERL